MYEVSTIQHAFNQILIMLTFKDNLQLDKKSIQVAQKGHRILKSNGINVVIRGFYYHCYVDNIFWTTCIEKNS